MVDITVFKFSRRISVLEGVSAYDSLVFQDDNFIEEVILSKMASSGVSDVSRC